jgi:hypothetical protein
MAEQRSSTFPFIISTPQNLDRHSLALRQAHARSHAARVSRSAFHRPSVLSEPGNPFLPTSQSQNEAHAPHSTEDVQNDKQTPVNSKGRHHEVDNGEPNASPRHRTTKAQHFAKHTGVIRVAQTGRQRQGDTRIYMSPLKLDPLYWIPYQRHRGVYVALGHCGS